MRYFVNYLEDNKKYFIHASVLMAAMALLLFIYLGRLGGNYKDAILSAEHFGMPEELREDLDMSPTYLDKETVGWDGQFYFYIANDLLGTKGYELYVDRVAYRWQRVGLPLLSCIISKILLQEHVSVSVYLFTNLLILFAGLFVLIRFLGTRGYSELWAIPWLFSIGVVVTMFNCLPDGAADALFIIAFLMLLQGKLPWYSGFMTLACLTREGYVLIAFGVFLAALLGEIKFNDIYIYIYKNKKANFKNFIMFAFPGIVFIAWYLYVTVRFNVFPFSQAEDITQFFLTAWPSFFLNAIQNGRLCEILGLLLYLIIIITALFLSVIAGRVNKLFYAITPYVILIGSFGPVVMANYAGYLKGSSVLFFLIPIMFLTLKERNYGGKEKSSKSGVVLRNVTVMLMFFSVAVSALCVSDKVLSTKIPQDLNQTNKTAVVDEVKPLEDFAASLDIITYDYKAKSNIPMASVFVDDYAICELEITNLSAYEWQNVMQSDGSGFLAITYRWYKESDTAFEQCILEGNRTAVGKDVKPEESLYRKMYVEYPKESGEYILRIALIQEGYAWFYQYGTGYVDIPVVVK